MKQNLKRRFVRVIGAGIAQQVQWLSCRLDDTEFESQQKHEILMSSETFAPVLGPNQSPVRWVICPADLDSNTDARQVKTETLFQILSPDPAYMTARKKVQFQQLVSMHIHSFMNQNLPNYVAKFREDGDFTVTIPVTTVCKVLLPGLVINTGKPFLFSSAVKTFLRCWDAWGARQLVYIIEASGTEPHGVSESPPTKDYFNILQNSCMKRTVADAGYCQG